MRSSETWRRRLVAAFVSDARYEAIIAFLDNDVPSQDLPAARLETDFRATTVAVLVSDSAPSDATTRWSTLLSSAPVVHSVHPA
jgi:hypothetical protein